MSISTGGTWGFVLDNLLGTDEGFREFLWDPFDGMRYAMGTLTTGRFGRFQGRASAGDAQLHG